jgi:hypothetical protein
LLDDTASSSVTPMHATVLAGRNNSLDVLVDRTRYLCRLKGKTLRLDERTYDPLAPGALDAARYESYLRLSEELADLQEDYS